MGRIIGGCLLAAIVSGLPIGSLAAAEFAIEFSDADQTRRLIEGATITPSGCTVDVASVAGRSALQIKTRQEFCDVFIAVEELGGDALDLRVGGWLTMDLYMPGDSWTSAIKLNVRDADGNLGGIPEVANNFVDHTDRWITIVTDLRPLIGRYETWHGDGNVLQSVSHLSINPFTADQADDSSFYIGSIALTSSRPDRPVGDSIEGTIPPEQTFDRNLSVLDFDDRTTLRRQLAYRSFESSFQSLRGGVAGNPTRAIRVQGQPDLNNIALLPMLDRLTGGPVDFREVDSIRFRYHLVPGGDDFDGCSLTLASQHWQSILIAKDAGIELIPGNVTSENVTSENGPDGQWRTATIKLDELEFDRVRGEQDVLAAVHELRLNLNYRGEQKNIECWFDDFEWQRSGESEVSSRSD